MKKEIYKDKYVVYENGEVYSLKRNVWLKKHLNKNGYYQVMINSKREYLHRVVMEAFKGISKLTVDHIDENKTNNSLDNLEYVTQAENNKRYRIKSNNKNQLLATAKRSNCVTWSGKVFKSQRQLASYLGISSGFVTTLIKENRIFKGSCILMYMESQGEQ